MNNELKDIINQSSYTVLPGKYIYTKVSKVPTTAHFLITQDQTEITVVTTEEKLNELVLIERNKDDYALICLNVSIPFYSVGFLAEVSAAIAKEGMDILIISTYSKDYILVKEDKTEIAKQTLNNLGLSEV